MINVNGLSGKVTGDVTSLVGELGKRADANHDGRVSSDEFAQFLTQQLINQTNTPGTTAPAATNQSPREAAMTALGRILEKFSPTPAGLGDAMPSIQKAFPGTTPYEHDQIDVPGLGRINVGLSFGNSGGAIWRSGR